MLLFLYVFCVTSALGIGHVVTFCCRHSPNIERFSIPLLRMGMLLVKFWRDFAREQRVSPASKRLEGWSRSYNGRKQYAGKFSIDFDRCRQSFREGLCEPPFSALGINTDICKRAAFPLSLLLLQETSCIPVATSPYHITFFSQRLEPPSWCTPPCQFLVRPAPVNQPLGAFLFPWHFLSLLVLVGPPRLPVPSNSWRNPRAAILGLLHHLHGAWSTLWAPAWWTLSSGTAP